MRRTVLQFRTLGAVIGRSAADHGADPAIRQPHAVATRDRIRLRGEAGVVEDRIEKVAGTVAGKGAARAIGAVGARSQPQDQHPSFFITEGRDRLGPINPIAVSTTLAGGYFLAILAQTGAALAADHVLVEKNQRAGRGRARLRRRQTGTCNRRARANGRTWS